MHALKERCLCAFLGSDPFAARVVFKRKFPSIYRSSYLGPAVFTPFIDCFVARQWRLSIRSEFKTKAEVVYWSSTWRVLCRNPNIAEKIEVLGTKWPCIVNELDVSAVVQSLKLVSLIYIWWAGCRSAKSILYVGTWACGAIQHACTWSS